MSVSILPRPKRILLLGGSRPLSHEQIEYLDDPALPPEGYALTVCEVGAQIRFADARGRFYAEQTLSQLRREDGSVPLVRIEDAPRFSYRAFMIDSVRHMQTVEEIKTYIEAAARFKFNVFHWHLCDDQGWRMESERFPRLNEIGSFRSGAGFGSDDETPYGGYYTKDEIREILAFCEARCIEVVPEIDMPGHVLAVLASYPELSCTGGPFKVETKPGIFKDILCAGKEETFNFCFGILEEVMELFPGKYLHIGGDEAPKQRWEACPDCKARMQMEGLPDGEALQGYFVNRIASFLKQHGRTPIAWNESLNSGMLSNEVVIADWMDKAHRCEAFANDGGKIILEDFFHFYLDYPYGMTPLRKTYGFDLLQSRLTETGRANVLGVETPIWTEFVADFKRLCYLCFPRMLAVAELGWSPQEALNRRSFAQRAEAQRSWLESIGIRMAPRSHWDPRGPLRLGGVAQHYKTFLTPQTIRSWLRHDEEKEPAPQEAG